MYRFQGVYDQFLAEFVKKTKEQVVGDGFDERTHIGPVVNQDQYERLIDFITDAKDRGAKILTG